MGKNKFPLDNVMTIAEASKKWGISISYLRNAINRYGKFDKQIERDLVKKSGGTWLITVQAMKEVFGEPKGEEKKE